MVSNATRHAKRRLDLLSSTVQLHDFLQASVAGFEDAFEFAPYPQTFGPTFDRRLG